MSPTARADANPKSSRVRDVIDDVVRPARVGADACRHKVQIQTVPRAPRDVVVGAGCVPAYAKGSDKLPLGIVESQAAAKHVDPTDFSTNHRIIWLTIILRFSSISNERIDWIAMLQAEETSSGLGGGIEIGGRERKLRQTKRIRRICFLRGDDTASPATGLRGWYP